MSKIPRGEPYAGKLHVRFDEGADVPCGGVSLYSTPSEPSIMSTNSSRKSRKGNKMKVNGARIVVFFAAVNSSYADTAKFSALVIDDSANTPIPGVTVRANFAEYIGWRAWTESPKPDVDIKVTGRDGRCRLTGKTNCGDVCAWVLEPPQGYYAGRGWGHGYKEKNLFGVWQPDNLVATIRLQRVEHPIPLYVREVRKLRDEVGRLGGFDGTNAVLRYDFVAGDWLPPDGTGKQADMIIWTHYAVSGTFTDMVKSLVFYDFTNEIEFPGEGNGVYEESFEGRNCGIRFRAAPSSGYAHRKKLCIGYRKRVMGPNVFGEYYSDRDENRCYCFRIRSKYDDKGKLVEAYYGKIYGDFKFSGHLKLGFDGVEFYYYLNPTSLDRNLEWDMKTNLCPNPGSLGRVMP